MKAPHVVAKGADHLAMRIRGLHNRTTSQWSPVQPLARSLFQHAALDQEIPAGLYIAVAHVLAYLFRLRETAGDERDAPLSRRPPDTRSTQGRRK